MARESGMTKLYEVLRWLFILLFALTEVWRLEKAK
jgi:hypothetical protein